MSCLSRCCNVTPCLLANPELALVCSLLQNQQTLCSISNTCDSFRFQVLYKLVDDSSKRYRRYSILILVSNLSLILILKFKSNAGSDTDTDTDRPTLISLPHHAPVGPNS